MRAEKKTTDVIIIGGGILGICTAYYLAVKGQKNIVLLEKGFLAEGSTGLSVGGFRQQFSHPANILLSQESVRIFKDFQQNFAMDIDFHQVGYLFLAKKKETWDDMLQGVQTQLEYNVPVEVLTPEEIKYRWPYLNIDDIQGGTFGPEDGYADPYHVVMGYAKEAKKLGVFIEEKTEVISLSMKEGKIIGVETNQGFISTNSVVNAAGPWAGEVARMAGLDLAVKPYRRQVFVITDCEFIPRPVPMIIDVENRSYFRGESADILAGMSDLEEPSSFNMNVDQNFMERVVESLIHRAPDMVRARMLRGWAGLYTITPDDNAIIGRIPELDGFYCAIGFSGHGFQHGPAVGRILSEIILDGHTDFDLSPFAHDRFEKKKKPGEKRVV